MMQPLQYTFKSKGTKEFNDDIFDEPAFDLAGTGDMITPPTPRN